MLIDHQHELSEDDLQIVSKVLNIPWIRSVYVVQVPCWSWRCRP